MISYKTGNILHEDVEALVNTVNCVGVMGRGIALQFKKAFPTNFKLYADACSRDDVRPGRMFVTETAQIGNPRYIVNFPTKRHWRGKSRIEDISSGLAALVSEIQCREITSIAIPPLGSGLGGLDWNVVRPLIEDALQPLQDVAIVVFEPSNPNVSERPNRSLDVPKMTPGRAALVGLMDRYLGGLLDPFVTLLEVHKLMYFMQEADEPLQLRFAKARYGPYANNLRHVLNAIEGHLVSGYRDGGDSPDKQLSLIPGAIDDALKFLTTATQTNERFNRVSDLVVGFESQFGLELLSTVHWVVTRENAMTIDDIISATYNWNSRKREFSERQIKLAATVLLDKGWISLDD